MQKLFSFSAWRFAWLSTCGLLFFNTACQRDDELFLTPQSSSAVTLEQAQQVAEHLGNTNVASFTTTLKTVSNRYILTAEKQPALFVFNYQDGGFSIISADKHLMPVLAYSATGSYTNTNKPGGLLIWEQKIAQTIVDAHATATPTAPEDVTREWMAALNSKSLNRQKPLSKDAKSISGNSPITNRVLPPDEPPQDTYTTVGPLLPVTWGQGCTYNDLCPAGNYCNPHAPTGCVMTAMAQVMAYWRYPNTYNWGSMPTASGNAEVQRLMVDAGSAVPSTEYKSQETGAYMKDVVGNGKGFRITASNIVQDEKLIMAVVLSPR